MLQNGGTAIGGEAGATIGAAGDGLIRDATTATFMKDVIEESRKQPVLVDFWAPWCGPCKQLTPVLEKAVRAAKGKVKLVKMDIDKNPEIPGQMGIQSIPAVIAFVNGQPADGFLGALPEGQVVAFLERLTKEKLGGGGEGTDLIKNADAALAQGDATTAAEIYAAILATDSANVAAIAGLARAHVKLGTLEQAKRMLAMVPEAKRNDPAVAAAQAAIDLAEQAKSVGPLTDLEAKVNANPADHQARFDLAVALNAAGKKSEAAQHLLDIIKRDRKWNEDAARKQLLQFFEAWGATDQATLEGRKKLSSILFS
jgi:putative thioredoxin